MPQVVLNQPRIPPFVGEGESATVPQHVRMNFNGQLGALANLLTDVIERLPSHWTALREKDQRRIATGFVDALPQPCSQGTNLIPL